MSSKSTAGIPQNSANWPTICRQRILRSLTFASQPRSLLYTTPLPQHKHTAEMESNSFDQADLDRLSPQDKTELRSFINNEQQKARIQQRTSPVRFSPRWP